MDSLDQKYYCLLKCLGDQSHIIKADGTVNMVLFRKREKLPKFLETIEKRVDKCVEEAGKILTCPDVKKLLLCRKQLM